MSDEYEIEPIPGLPAYLPEGESLLWQGAPVWTSVARHVFHAGLVASYFAILIAWRLGSAAWTGDDMTTALASSLWLLVIAAVALGVVALLGYLTQRTTVYSITSRRVVMRFGIALPLTVNLPFACIASADLKANRDGTGDVALTLTGNGKLAYFHLWPHARPWHLKQTQPMLRCLAEPSRVANLLSSALQEAHPDAARNIVRPNQETVTATRGSAGFGTAQAV